MTWKKIGSETVFGTGPDGAITEDSNTTKGGLFMPTTYEVQSGVTVTSDNSVFAVIASEKITISGTIDASGQGASGGSGGRGREGSDDLNTKYSEPGEDGNNATYVGKKGTPGTAPSGTDGVNGAGGGGARSNVYNESVDGTSNEGGGRNGGSDGNLTITQPERKHATNVLTSPVNRNVFKLAALGGAGGGGGGGGGGGEAAFNGGGDGGSGGDGGDGGGLIYLAAPEIEITGKLNVEGKDGNSGGDSNGTHGERNDNNSVLVGGGGGGGAGGNGGAILLGAKGITDSSATYQTSGGNGGSGGDGIVYDPNQYTGTSGYPTVDGIDGGDGGNGAEGVIIKQEF
jgi:hypothetical protein